VSWLHRLNQLRHTPLIKTALVSVRINPLAMRFVLYLVRVPPLRFDLMHFIISGEQISMPQQFHHRL
jgi:hypothetical protein